MKNKLSHSKKTINTSPFAGIKSLDFVSAKNLLFGGGQKNVSSAFREGGQGKHSRA